MNPDLRDFIREALRQNLSRDQIRQALQAANWPSDEVDRALQYYAEVDFPVPVPRRKPSLSAQEAFLYLLVFLTLYVSAIEVGQLAFTVIERWFPDPLDRNARFLLPEQITVPLASVIVAFPLYVWFTGILIKRLRKNPELRGSEIRKWLTYLTLFVASATIIADLITLLTRLLQGELTTRFILKVLVVLIISGLVFLYYLSDLRPEEKEEP
ncbi:MAG TPA: DUF5671 domain-containing protein [Candidatus Eisenbacteria bacterium]|nr:DUF5671 domain-containing protein [Candidatus Eisenbacteria bacterium]